MKNKISKVWRSEENKITRVFIGNFRNENEY